MNLLTVDDVAVYLGVPRSAAYAILHRADCPTIMWGKRMYIRGVDLDEWIMRHRRDITATKGGGCYDR